jgi:hypothetical protein
MLANKNHTESACFVPTVGGAFARFNSLTGEPMPAGPADGHGLYDAGGGRMGFGRLPASMAQDSAEGLTPNSAGYRHPSAPTSFQPAPELPRTSASGMGVKAETADQEGGGRKISRDTASKIWSLAKDKISPAELATLVQMLKGMIDPDLADEPEQGQDQPPAFPGRPERPGIVGDAALAAFKSEYGLDRIGHAPPYGEPVPKSKYLREAERLRRENPRLALDARSGGNSLGEKSDADLAAAIEGCRRIGRAF